MIARVTTWMMTVSLVACGARSTPRATTPVPRPEASPDAPAQHAPVPTPLELIVQRPSSLELFDAKAGAFPEEALSAPSGGFPPTPRVQTPERPREGGEELALADLALARGDALDASVQYRALMSKIDSAGAPYARYQLARAYLTLGDRPRATHLLQALSSAGGAIGWASLVELAEMRTVEVGAREALLELKVAAGARFEDLADHLIHTSADNEAAQLLLDKAARLARCEYAIQAIVLVPETPYANVPSPCQGIVEYRRTALDWREHDRRVFDFRVRMNPFVTRWDALEDAALRGDRNLEPWLLFAEDLGDLRSVVADSDQLTSLRHIAAAAISVAIELSLAHPAPDTSHIPRIRSLLRQVDAGDREVIKRRILYLLEAYGGP